MEVLQDYKSQFGVDFANNKKILDEISIVRSKPLKNKVAGYITNLIKTELRIRNQKEELIKREQERIQKRLATETAEPTTETAEPTTETAEPTTETAEPTQ